MTFDGWSPVRELRTEAVSPWSAAALHGLLDSPGEGPAANDPLPPLWHWLAFLPDALQRELGVDGHPRIGSFMPPTELPRRMFAGGRLSLTTDVPVGVPLHRRSVVTNVSEKSGRSGRLLFVEVTNEISLDEAEPPAIIEVQEIVYREKSSTSQASQRRPRDAQLSPIDEDNWEWKIDLGTEPALLFRFSALTYNAHRIHYDRDYATTVEGYPGLVVQGPLQAIGLAEICRRNCQGRRVRAFAFRSLRPAFDGAAVRLRGRWASGERVELFAFDREGQRTMKAEATFE